MPRRPLWSGDGVVACSRRDGKLEIHDVELGQHVELDGIALGWDRPGQHLLIAASGWFSVWDRRSSSPIDVPRGFERAEWLGRGSLLRLGNYAGGDDRIWDPERRAFNGMPIAFGLRSTSTSGAHVLALPSNERDAILIDADTGAQRRLASGASVFDGPPDKLLFFSPDGATVAVPLANLGARLFDTTTFAEIGTLVATGCETPLQIAWSPTGDAIATGSDSSHICVFDGSSLRLRRSWEVPLRIHADSRPTAGVLLLTFFAGGRGIVAGNWDGQGYSVSVWELPSGNELEPRGNYATLDGVRVTTHGDAITESAHIDVNLRFQRSFVPYLSATTDISAEGRFVAGDNTDSNSSGLRTVGAPLPTFEHADGATFLSMSPDGAKVLGVLHGEPRVWNLTTGRQLAP